MDVGERLTELRAKSGMSQGEVEKKTGLLRCYISRAEHGHTVPSVETLEKLASAYGLPLYRLFYDGEVPAKVKAKAGGTVAQVPEIPEMKQLRKYLARISEQDCGTLLRTAAIMARRKK